MRRRLVVEANPVATLSFGGRCGIIFRGEFECTNVVHCERVINGATCSSHAELRMARTDAVSVVG